MSYIMCTCPSFSFSLLLWTPTTTIVANMPQSLAFARIYRLYDYRCSAKTPTPKTTRTQTTTTTTKKHQANKFLVYFCIHFDVITIGWLIVLIRIACKIFYLCLNVKNRVYCNNDDFIQWSGQFLYAQLNNSGAWQQTSSLFILLIFSRDHINVSWEYHTREYVFLYKVTDCRQTTRCWAVSHIGHSDHEEKRRWKTTHNLHM